MIVGSKYASDWDSFFCAQQFHQKLGSFIHLFLLFVHNCSTKISSHSYSSIHYFLNCANTMYAIFMVELLLHIYERTVLIFHALYLWIHEFNPKFYRTRLRFWRNFYLLVHCRTYPKKINT